MPDFEQEVISRIDAANAVEHVRELSVDIGPRLGGTPQELAGARYIGGVLESYGFDVDYQQFPSSTKRVATVTSPSNVLEGGPNWQLSASASAKFTGDEGAVQGEVIYAGTGQQAADFPAGTAGKIVLIDYSSSAATRNTAVVNAVAAGAIAVILAQPSGNSAPPSFTLTTAQPGIPVVGGGTAHSTRIKSLLAAGRLTLRIATNEYVTPLSTNVIGTRKAVGDPTGTTAPIVMVSGHLDSVLGSPGANDDASGIGVALEVARVLSDYPLDKELRIAGWGSEEAGLVGSRFYANSLSQSEIDRFAGLWQMDMVGTPYTEDAREWKFWGHTADGSVNSVLRAANATAARVGYTDIGNGRMTGSDHQPFHDKGIPAGVFSWMYWAPPGSYGLEPDYHRPSDALANNIDQSRLQLAGEVIGGSAFTAAVNTVTVEVRSERGALVPDAGIRANCGDGWRDLGVTGAEGTLSAAVPHGTCDFAANKGYASATNAGQAVHTDTDVAINVDLTAGAFDEIDDLVDGLVAEGRLAPHVAASISDRLGKARVSSYQFSELYAIGYIEQAIARANNQVKGDADDTAVRNLLLAELRDLISYHEGLHRVRKAGTPAAA
jgi:hypothetical protein